MEVNEGLQNKRSTRLKRANYGLGVRFGFEDSKHRKVGLPFP